MNIKEMYIQKESKSLRENEISNFLKKWHYSKTVKGLQQKEILSLRYKGRLIGVCVFSLCSGINTAKKYANTNPKKVYELRRLCLIDNTPKNAESYFIGKCLRYLKQNTSIDTIVSYADPNKGHKGIIYKASNFNYLGTQKTNNAVIKLNDKFYHTNIYRNNKNIKKLLDIGKAKRVKLKPKHVFVYNLKR